MNKVIIGIVSGISCLAATYLGYKLGHKKAWSEAEQMATNEINEYKRHIYEDVLKAKTIEEFKAKHEIDILEDVLEIMDSVDHTNDGFDKVDRIIRQRQVELEDVANHTFDEDDEITEAEVGTFTNEGEPVYFDKASVSSDNRKHNYNKITEVPDEDKDVVNFIKKYEEEHGITYDNDENEEDEEVEKKPIHFDNEPYTIDMEEYDDSMADNHWSTESVYYHIDEDIIYQGDGDLIDKDWFGEENIIDMKPGDTVYIRNEDMKTDFEVIGV